MLEAFRSTGGLAPGNLLCQSLLDHQRGDLSHLARLIVDRRLFVFDWRGDSWIPMFQFDGHDLTCKPGPARVRAELPGLCSGWAVAAWFAQPNAKLDGCRPVALMDSDLAAVVEAARCHAPAGVMRSVRSSPPEPARGQLAVCAGSSRSYSFFTTA